MRAVIAGVHFDEAARQWIVDVEEYHNNERDISGNPDIVKRCIFPESSMAFRCAEYNLNPGDFDTLVDIIVCEFYIDPTHWEGKDHLWAAPTVEDARIEYLKRIAETKAKIRLSTRGRKHPLNEIKIRTTLHPADVAVKAMGVILERHRTEVQVQDPHVIAALEYMERAVQLTDPNIQTSPEEPRTRKI